eukprot:COSAG02_NODE_29255_length_573_cov_0.689873_1_plen_130_part_01
MSSRFLPPSDLRIYAVLVLLAFGAPSSAISTGPPAERVKIATEGGASNGTAKNASTSAARSSSSCLSVAGCPVGQYCDSTHSCYDCSALSKIECNAIDHDCCSEAFLRNCPTNSKKCKGARKVRQLQSGG